MSISTACADTHPQVEGRETATASRVELDYDSLVRTVLSRMVRRCPKSRVQIAEEMSALAGRPVTKFMLDSYTSEAHEGARFPACLVPIVCQVCGSDDLARLLLGDRLRELLDIGERHVNATAELLAVEQSLKSLRDRRDRLVRGGDSRKAG